MVGVIINYIENNAYTCTVQGLNQHFQLNNT